MRILHGLRHYLANLALIWLAILFYRYNSYYAKFLRADTQTTLLYLAISYTIIGFVYYVVIPIEKKESKGMVLLKAVPRFLKEMHHYLKKFVLNSKHPLPKLEKHEKTALLFVLVKIFYMPIMLNFFFANYYGVKAHLVNMSTANLFSISTFNIVTYPLIIAIFFLVDTLYFSFGYAVESGFLKNTIKSVEPTVLGWGVALVCYPPFNGFFTEYVSWYANDSVWFGSDMVTMIVRIILILLVFLYLSATLALGFKCSNLTNRGIVSRGPYAFIRHPAYIGKNLVWWIAIIPVMSIGAFISMAIWSSIYFLRAITEERHLIKDPDYQAYCRKVKYRFIPWVF